MTTYLILENGTPICTCETLENAERILCALKWMFQADNSYTIEAREE